MTDGRVFLLRHGETAWSRDGQHTGRTDVPLTADGRRQAAAIGPVGAHLLGGRPAVVLSSPRGRAVDTAELAGLRVDRRDELLAEWDYGDYEGLTTPQIREHDPGWTVWTHPCPGGEDARAVTRRATEVLAMARAATGEGDVVLVGHGHFGRALLACWIGLGADQGVRFRMDAPSWAALGSERGVERLDHVNVGAGPPAPDTAP